MSTSEIFRTEFKGYNKKEVIDYISSLNSQMESLKSELDRAESELEKCRAELKENVSPAEETEPVDVDAIRKEAYLLAKEEFEQQKQAEKSSDEQLLSEYREKAQMYDEQKDLIAELVIKAKTDAAKMIEDAQTKSKQLLNDTYDTFEKAREDFIQMRKNVVAGKSELDARIAAVAHYLNDFSNYLNILEKDVINTGENFKENL